MRKALPLALAVAVVATALVPAVSSASAPSALQWGACPADVASPGLTCSTLDVPLDYRHPDGRKIQVEISRLASKNPAKRRGVLMTNDGGPGGTDLTFPAAMVKLGLPQSVLDSYDIIGFDPRGIGYSTPVSCDLNPAQQAQGKLPPYAVTAADVTKDAAAAKAVARQCADSKTGPLLPYITTANTARDMDQIREALGEPKISYYGTSYGTYLGAVYTTLYPRRSDRFVLDSNLGPDGFDVAAARLFGRGFQDRFPDFAKFAAANPQYGLGTTPAQVTAKYFQLAGRLDKAPYDGFDGRQFRSATQAAFYFENKLPALAAGWQALGTNPKPAAPAAAPQPPAVTPETDLGNQISAFFAVTCGDSSWPRSVSTYQANVATDRIRYPMYGAASANIQPCAFWPTAPIEPKVRIGDRGPSNVLMVQNLRDPATPLTGARKLAQALGDRARMVTVDQGGHVAYLFGANKCANSTVSTYLATGQRPAPDTTCAAEPA
jgi:pimeloyl-ACP methyl ester carboxylesterase